MYKKPPPPFPTATTYTNRIQTEPHLLFLFIFNISVEATDALQHPIFAVVVATKAAARWGNFKPANVEQTEKIHRLEQAVQSLLADKGGNCSNIVRGP